MAEPTKREVLLLDLVNIAESARRLTVQAQESGFAPDDELFAEIRDLRDRMIRL